RGYLTITELPPTGILGLGKKDWSLARTDGKAHPEALQDYERTIFDGLFGYGAMDATQRAVVSRVRRFSDQQGAAAETNAAFESTPTAVVKLSELNKHFYTTLAKAQRELYADSVT